MRPEYSFTFNQVETLNAAVDRLRKLSPEEFRAELERMRDKNRHLEWIDIGESNEPERSV